MSDFRIQSGASLAAYSGFSPPVPAEEKPVVSEHKINTESIQEIAGSKDAPKAEPLGKVAAPTAQDLKRLTEEMERRVGAVDSQLQFSVDESTGQFVVKVTDRKTHEVIRQIPSEEMLQIAKGLDRYKEGLLVNSKA